MWGPSGFYMFWKGDTKKPHIILESYKLLWQTPGRQNWSNLFFQHRNFNQMLSLIFFWGGIFPGMAAVPPAFRTVPFLRSNTSAVIWNQPTPTNEMSTHQAGCQSQPTKKNNQPKPCWLVVEPTPLKNISQIGNLPQIGVKIKII